MTPTAMFLAPAPVLASAGVAAAADDAALAPAAATSDVAPFAAMLAAALPLAEAPTGPMLVEPGMADMPRAQEGQDVLTLPVAAVPPQVGGAAGMLHARLVLPALLTAAPDASPGVVGDGSRRVGPSPVLALNPLATPAPGSGRRLSAETLWAITEGRAPRLPVTRPVTAAAPDVPVDPVAAMVPLPAVLAPVQAMVDPSASAPNGTVEPGLATAMPVAVRAPPVRAAVVRVGQAVTEDAVQTAQVPQPLPQPVLPPALQPTQGVMTKDSAPGPGTVSTANAIASTARAGLAFGALSQGPAVAGPDAARRDPFELSAAGALPSVSQLSSSFRMTVSGQRSTLPGAPIVGTPIPVGLTETGSAAVGEAHPAAGVADPGVLARQPAMVRVAASMPTGNTASAAIVQHLQVGDGDPTRGANFAGLAFPALACPPVSAPATVTQPMASAALFDGRQADGQSHAPATAAGNALVVAVLTAKSVTDAAIAPMGPAPAGSSLSGVPAAATTEQPARGRADRSRPDRDPALDAIGVARPQSPSSLPITLAASIASAAATNHGTTAPRVSTLPVAMTVPSERLGDVSIGLEGGPHDLRVQLSGSAAAVGTMTAEAPRLAADLAANGLRLQSLDFGGADGGSGQGGFQTTGQGLAQNSTAFSGQPHSEGRPRAAPPRQAILPPMPLSPTGRETSSLAAHPLPTVMPEAEIP